MKWLALTAAALQTGGVALAAQGPVRPDTTMPAGTIVGSVVAAQTGAPLDGATVLLEPAPGGALPGAARGSAFWEAGRIARTDANGGYRFDRLAVGRYQLHVRRLGYRPASLEIDLAGPSPFRLSVGLVVVPIALEPVDVPGAAAPPIAAFRADADAAARARLMAEEDRRNRFLASDARSLTGADLTEAITLGETDLFRALQRLPSVATRDDFTAELWTRGARWTDTRVTFDGMPLFSPVHAFGVVTAVDPAAVGSAFFHPGVRPAASGEGAAGALDLASRPATEPGLHGSTELSVISARAALEHGTSGAGIGWMLAARRSYIDLASALVAALRNDSTVRIPYAFTDLAGRLDVPFGPTRALEMSGLWSEDALRGSVPHLLRGNSGRWGNAIIRATLVTALGGLVARHTVGVSRFDTRVESAESYSPGGVPVHDPTRSGITFVALDGSLGPAAEGGWAVGYRLASQRLRYDGWDATDYAAEATTILIERRQFRGATNLIAVWGERRSQPHARLTMLTGIRVELGTPVADAPAVRIAPRLQARYLVGDGRLTLSAGYGRSFQYTQVVGPTGPGVGPELHLSDVWLMAGDTVPAIRADIATAGAEYWTSGGWIAALQVYRRHESGVAVPDPTPGRYQYGRPLFVPAVSVAGGAEVSLRKLAGRWTTAISLATGDARITARGYRYDAPTARRRVLHATAMLRASRAVRVGGALTAASGARFTRFVPAYECVPGSQACPPPADPDPPYIEAPGGGQAPGYTTLDLLLDWRREYRSWSLGAYAQLRNALNATNVVTYAGSVDRCWGGQPPTKVEVRPGLCDYYARGLPLLPLAGVRVSF